MCEGNNGSFPSQVGPSDGTSARLLAGNTPFVQHAKLFVLYGALNPKVKKHLIFNSKGTYVKFLQKYKILASTPSV